MTRQLVDALSVDRTDSYTTARLRRRLRRPALLSGPVGGAGRTGPVAAVADEPVAITSVAEGRLAVTGPLHLPTGAGGALHQRDVLELLEAEPEMPVRYGTETAAHHREAPG